MSDRNPEQVLKSKECSTNQTIGHLEFMLASGFDPGQGLESVTSCTSKIIRHDSDRSVENRA